MSGLSIENLSGFRTEAGSISSQQRSERSSSQNTSSNGAGSFSELLEKSFAEVNQDQQRADRAVKELVAGRTKNVHETMLAVEKADLSLKLMMQVRNKIVAAYKEIMRMQV